MSQNSPNILEILPAETLELIIQYMGPIVASWPVLSRVCKSLHFLALSHRLWHTVEFRDLIFGHNAYLICTKNFQHQYIHTMDIYKCKGLSASTLQKFSEFSSMERLSIRYSSMEDSPECIMRMSKYTPYYFGEMSVTNVNKAHGNGGEDMVDWPQSLKFLNLTNFNGPKLFSLVRCTNLETLLISGNQGSPNDILGWTLNSKNTLLKLDVSRTTLRQEQISTLLQSCINLKLLVATEVMQRSEEINYSRLFPKVEILFDLLSHKVDPINARKQYITALYDVDGKGCSLLADGIYVGMEISALRHIVHTFNIDPNKCQEPASPWVVPFPMKHLTSVTRFPLALHQASAFFQVDTIRFLLEVGADPNLKCPENIGRTALSLAMSNIANSQQCLQVCTILVQGGGLLDIPDNNGKTPIDYAVESKKMELLTSLILESTQKINQTVLNSVLHTAIERENYSLFHACISKGGDPSALNANGTNCLMEATKKESFSMIQTILSVKSDLINVADANGWTPIHFSLLSHNQEFLNSVIKLFTEHGVDLTLKTKTGLDLQEFCRANDHPINFFASFNP